jgi:NAD(P)-dependent dehydrogenase (short-subunit alcohol dehydrogenase family)
MDLGLKDKVVIVTGASKGIGLAIARAFVHEGANVVISARNRDQIEAAAKVIADDPRSVIGVASDQSTAQGCEAVVRDAIDRFGTVHVLVNNAGSIGSFSSFLELTDEDWMSLFHFNVMSAVRMTRGVLPYMKKQRWGRIINIASESGVQPDAEMPHYNATKAAMINLTKSLSKAYGRDNILVNTVSPAFIMTPLVREMLGKEAKKSGVSFEHAEQDFLTQHRPNIVLQRAGTPEETAGLVVFLAGEQANFVTGANFRVDGGSVASV